MRYATKYRCTSFERKERKELEALGTFDDERTAMLAVCDLLKWPTTVPNLDEVEIEKVDISELMSLDAKESFFLMEYDGLGAVAIVQWNEVVDESSSDATNVPEVDEKRKAMRERLVANRQKLIASRLDLEIATTAETAEKKEEP